VKVDEQQRHNFEQLVTMNDNNVNINNIEDDSNITTVELTVEATIEGDDDEDILCPGCGEGPCVFLSHKESPVAFDESEHSSLAPEDVPTNNIRRKKLYRQLTLMLNGGPLGAGVRKPLPDCCVSAVREMMPSSGACMGFRTE
jgi:hypothetical protein